MILEAIALGGAAVVGSGAPSVLRRVRRTAHVPLPLGCGSHDDVHWCGNGRGHVGDHLCAHCDVAWLAAPEN